MDMHLLLFVIVVPSLCLSVPVTEVHHGIDLLDKCSHDRVDRCTENLVVYSINDTLPLTPEGIAEACEREKKDLECMQDFLDSGCVEGFARALLIASHERISDERDAKCDPSSERRKGYMQYIPCLNTVGPQIRSCMTSAVSQLEAIHRHTSKRERIPFSCCRFEEYLQCVADVAAGACSRDHVDFVLNVLNNAAGDVLTTACETYRGASVCSALRKLPLEEPKARAYTSPMIKVLEHLG